MADDGPILIGPEHLDPRVDFERGMSAAPPLTLALLGIQALVFAAELAAGALQSPSALLAFGALEAGGAPWRLWSATLLHGSIDHLLGNALALYVTGMACERAFGSVQTGGLYAAAGFAGSLLSLAGLEPGVPAVGASGAIFGLMGAAAVVFLRHSKRLIVRDKRTGLVLAAWIVYSVLLGLATPYVDNRAHLGGLAAGVAAAFVLQPRVLEPGRPLSGGPRILCAATALAALLGTAGWIRHAMG